MQPQTLNNNNINIIGISIVRLFLLNSMENNKITKIEFIHTNTIFHSYV